MRRILLVEDSASTRSFVRSALEAERTGLGPIEIIEASSGFDALRLLPRGRYDLVITDINMPDINGFELIQFIRKSDRHRTTATIIISSQSSERDRGLSLGANEFLIKPLTPQGLVSTVKRVLSQSVAGS